MWRDRDGGEDGLDLVGDEDILDERCNEARLAGALITANADAHYVGGTVVSGKLDRVDGGGMELSSFSSGHLPEAMVTIFAASTNASIANPWQDLW